MHMRRLVSVLVLGVFLGGCVSAPFTDAAEDTAAKRFLPLSAKANLYIYRNESFDAGLKVPVLLDGAPVGSTVANSYFLIEMNPGRHSLISDADGEAALELVAEPGRNYFVRQQVSLGVASVRTALQQVSDEEGRAAVHECRRIKASSDTINQAAAGSTADRAAPAATAAQAPSSRSASPAESARPAAVARPPKTAPVATERHVPLLRRPVRGSAADSSLARGTRVELKGRSTTPEGEWWFVKAGAVVGWVPAASLSRISDTEATLR